MTARLECPVTGNQVAAFTDRQGIAGRLADTDQLLQGIDLHLQRHHAKELILDIDRLGEGEDPAFAGLVAVRTLQGHAPLRIVLRAVFHPVVALVQARAETEALGRHALRA